MKYFYNITTAEEIKKQFRTYCVSMHPDKGGDPEEFKQMMAEYDGIIKNFEQAKKRAEEEEEARQRAEEARKEAEERKRKDEEDPDEENRILSGCWIGDGIELRHEAFWVADDCVPHTFEEFKAEHIREGHWEAMLRFEGMTEEEFKADYIKRYAQSDAA